jgi:hypothetical protein
MKTLIKSTTDAMKEMMSLIKNERKAPNNQSNDEKKKKQEERCKWYNIAPICKHCGKKHPAMGKIELGTREKQRLPSIQIEVSKKHLKVCRAHTRIRDVATRKSEIE